MCSWSRSHCQKAAFWRHGQLSEMRSKCTWLVEARWPVRAVKASGRVQKNPSMHFVSVKCSPVPLWCCAIVKLALNEVEMNGKREGLWSDHLTTSGSRSGCGDQARNHLTWGAPPPLNAPPKANCPGSQVLECKVPCRAGTGHSTTLGQNLRGWEPFSVWHLSSAVLLVARIAREGEAAVRTRLVPKLAPGFVVSCTCELGPCPGATTSVTHRPDPVFQFKWQPLFHRLSDIDSDNKLRCSPRCKFLAGSAFTSTIAMWCNICKHVLGQYRIPSSCAQLWHCDVTFQDQKFNERKPQWMWKPGSYWTNKWKEKGRMRRRTYTRTRPEEKGLGLGLGWIQCKT